MSTEQQPIDAQTIEDTKQQIRGLIGEITTLSRQELDPQVFYGEFLQRIVAALAAVSRAPLDAARWQRADAQLPE